MISHQCGIRTLLFLHHISDHKSINSGPNDKFETDPRSREHPKTFCQLRLFATPLLQNSFAMISHQCGIRNDRPKSKLQTSISGNELPPFFVDHPPSCLEQEATFLEFLSCRRRRWIRMQLLVVSLLLLLLLLLCAPKYPENLEVPPRECLSSNVLLRSEVTFLYHF